MFCFETKKVSFSASRDSLFSKTFFFVLNFSFCLKPVCLPAFSSSISGKSENCSINLIISCVLRFFGGSGVGEAQKKQWCTCWTAQHGFSARAARGRRDFFCGKTPNLSFSRCPHSRRTRQDVKVNSEHSHEEVELNLRVKKREAAGVAVSMNEWMDSLSSFTFMGKQVTKIEKSLQPNSDNTLKTAKKAKTFCCLSFTVRKNTRNTCNTKASKE